MTGAAPIRAREWFAMASARRSYGTGQLYEKHGNWYGRWRDAAGGRFNRKVGAMQDLTRKQAERALQAMIDGEDAPGVVTHREDTVPALGAKALQWLEAKGRKKSHLETFERHVRVHMAPFFRDDPIARIDQDDIEAFMARLRRSGLAPKTIRNIHGSLHTVFAHAVRKKKLGRNVVGLVEPPAKVDSPDIHFLTLAELQAVIRAVPSGTDWSEWETALYTTAAMTGMRMGELLGLQWGDVDWTAQKIRIRRAWVSNEMGTPKSRRSSRAVPMVAAVVAALDQLSKSTHYGSDEDLVFGNVYSGVPPARSTVGNRFRTRLAEAGVRHLRFHDLRHTYGTLMAASGVPMRTLQELMGHRNLETTLIYADYAPSGQELTWAEAAFSTESGAPDEALTEHD